MPFRDKEIPMKANKMHQELIKSTMFYMLPLHTFFNHGNSSAKLKIIISKATNCSHFPVAETSTTFTPVNTLFSSVVIISSLFCVLSINHSKCMCVYWEGRVYLFFIPYYILANV